MKQTFLLVSFSLLLFDCAARPVVSRVDEAPVQVQIPIIIAHRGASGILPEHTIEAYRRAIEQGADFIEPDLVVTQDGFLVARHENEISGTTNIAEVFPERKTTKIVDGVPFTGWFVEDFKLSEIKKLKARQRLPFRDQSHNDRYAIPTLEEVLDLLIRQQQTQNRTIGIYPETKHANYFRAIGLPIEERLIGTLKKHNLYRKQDAVFIQSFDTENLKRLRQLTDIRLTLLLDTTWINTLKNDEAVLSDISKFAHGIGINKEMLFDQKLMLLAKAQAKGLFVHVWTFRNEAYFVPPQFKSDFKRELRTAFAMGVNGIFSDFPDSALAVRNQPTDLSIKTDSTNRQSR